LGKAKKTGPLDTDYCYFSPYNDTTVMDNVSPFLHTIFSHHISFISDLKKESHMDTSEQN